MVGLLSTKKTGSNMSYRQLTEGQRYQISAFLSQEFSQREIAKKLNIAPSTVHRELRRNNDKTGFMTLKWLTSARYRAV